MCPGKWEQVERNQRKFSHQQASLVWIVLLGLRYERFQVFNPGDDDWQDEDWYAPNTSLRRDAVCNNSHVVFLHHIISWGEFLQGTIEINRSSIPACCEVRRWMVGWWRWWMGWGGWMGWRMVSLVWCTRYRMDLYGAACKAICTILNDEILFGQFLAWTPKGESTVGKKKPPFEAETMYSRAKQRQ